jgi:hypothetical protein
MKRTESPISLDHLVGKLAHVDDKKYKRQRQIDETQTTFNVV